MMLTSGILLIMMPGKYLYRNKPYRVKVCKSRYTYVFVTFNYTYDIAYILLRNVNEILLNSYLRINIGCCHLGWQ